MLDLKTIFDPDRAGPAPGIGITPAVPAEQTETYRERLAVREHDEGLHREHAEAAAVDDTLALMGKWEPETVDRLVREALDLRSQIRARPDADALAAPCSEICWSLDSAWEARDLPGVRRALEALRQLAGRTAAENGS